MVDNKEVDSTKQNTVEAGAGAQHLDELRDDNENRRMLLWQTLASSNNSPMQLRCRAIRSLAENGGIKATPFLLRLMDSPENQVAATAAAEIGKLNDASVMEELLRIAYEDTFLDARRSAIRSLGMIDHPRTVTALTELLKDKEDEIRITSAQALRRKFDESVVATLIESLKDARWQVRAAVINTLGTFSDYEDTCGIIVKSLEKMINDEASEVRLATITNLANFYSSKYTKKITEILKLKTEDPLPVVALVAKKLEKAYNQKAVLLSRNSSKLAAIGFVITTVLAGIGISAASYLFLASKQAGKENVATVKRLELLSKYANLAATNMNADLERMSRSPQDMLTKYLFDDAVKGFKANLGGSDEQSKLRMVYYYTAACKAFQSNMDEAENYMDTAKGLK